MKSEEPIILIPWLTGGGSVWMDAEINDDIPQTISTVEGFIRNRHAREGKLFNSDSALCNWIKDSDDVLPDQRFILLFNGSINRFEKQPKAPFSQIVLTFNNLSEILYPVTFIHPSKKDKSIKLDTIMNVRINKNPVDKFKLVYNYICPLCYEDSGNRMTSDTIFRLAKAETMKRHSKCQRCGHEFITSNCLEVVDFDVDNQ